MVQQVADVGYVRNMCKMFVVKPEGKRLLGRLWRKLKEKNISTECWKILSIFE
jgi:ribosomal protein S19E (S16A)